MECEESGVSSGECSGWCVEWGLWSVKWRVECVECGVSSVVSEMLPLPRKMTGSRCPMLAVRFARCRRLTQP